MKNKLIELIGSTVYGNGSKIGENFQQGFIEKIADHLIENGATIQRWIPVSERLPEEKKYCLVHYVHTYCDNDGYWAIGESFFNGKQFQIGLEYKVTHWMPLPAPPKENVNDILCRDSKTNSCGKS